MRAYRPAVFVFAAAGALDRFAAPRFPEIERRGKV